MSTGNLLLGQGRNSIGDITLYIRNGKQIARARVRKIANPRSIKQAYQRMAFAAISDASSRLNAIVSNSFDSSTNGGPDLQRFASLNLPLARAAAINSSLTPALFPARKMSTGAWWPGFLLSDGALPFVQTPWVTSTEEYALPSIIVDDGDSMSMQRADFLAMMANAGLQQGDQLTFVTFGTPAGGDPTNPSYVWAYGRLIWTGTPEGDKIRLTQFGVETRMLFNPDVFSADGLHAVLLSIDEEDRLIIRHNQAFDTVMAMGIILTRVVNGKQRHSRCIMTAGSDFGTNNADTVLPTYLGGASPASPDVESEWYTENAENPQ